MIPLHSVCHGKYLFQCIVSHLECSLSLSLSLTKAIWFLALLFLIVFATSAQWAFPLWEASPFLSLSVLYPVPSVSSAPKRKTFSLLLCQFCPFFFQFYSLRKEICKWSQWLYFSLSVVPIPLHPVQERHYEWTPHVKLYFKIYTAESTADSVLFIISTVSHPASSGWPAFGPTALFCHMTWEISVIFLSSSPVMSLFSVWFLPWWHTLLHHSYTGLSFICSPTSSTSLQVPQIGEGFS